MFKGSIFTSFGFLTWKNADSHTTGYMECSAFIQQSSGSPAWNLNKIPCGENEAGDKICVQSFSLEHCSWCQSFRNMTEA